MSRVYTSESHPPPRRSMFGVRCWMFDVPEIFPVLPHPSTSTFSCIGCLSSPHPWPSRQPKATQGRSFFLGLVLRHSALDRPLAPQLPASPARTSRVSSACVDPVALCCTSCCTFVAFKNGGFPSKQANVVPPLRDCTLNPPGGGRNFLAHRLPSAICHLPSAICLPAPLRSP